MTMSKQDVKRFHIAEILSAATGRLYAKTIPVEGANHPKKGVYDILNFMTDDDLSTHQLPRASKECEPCLYQQFPWLKEITKYVVNKGSDWDTRWEMSHIALQEHVAKYGEYHNVLRLHPEDHEYIDPMAELENLVPEDKIITVILPDKEPPIIGDINW